MLRAAAVFSDHMVLQRERPVVVFGEADAPVTATIDVVRAEAVPFEGRFRLTLPPMPAGGPYELALTSGEEAVVFTDVMIGEVWLCGGQSNMEFMLQNGKGGAAEAAEADDAMLRFYTVNQEAEVDAAMLERERATAWKPLKPGTCGNVSAVAYYAGRRLREELGVAVGMLVCCVGGTEISNWISREALNTLPEGRDALAEFEKSIEGIRPEAFARVNDAYNARVAKWCEGAEALHRENPDIRAEAIVAAVGDFPWPPPTGPGMLRRPGNLWRTMAARVAPYGARGLFWYQGETDSGHSGRYAALFSALIEDWRRGFENESLCVVAAQLPNFGANPAAEDWPGIRAAQMRVCDGTRGCALACLLDCGETGDIHPWDKRLPGRRMADLALAHAYGRSIDAEAPRLESARPTDRGVALCFSEKIGPIRGDRRSLTANGKPAKARVDDGALIVEAAAPVKIAYAMENDPAACLFGRSGLPVFPFEIEVKEENGHEH